MENSETQIWPDFALAFGYLTDVEHSDFFQRSAEVGRLLNRIMDNPGSYGASDRNKEACG